MQPGRLVPPAALCLAYIALSIGFSIASSDANRMIEMAYFGQASNAVARASFPIEMKRWDEPLFNTLVGRAKADMEEFIKAADEAAAAPQSSQETGAASQEASEVTLRPPEETIVYHEQFRTLTLVGYLAIISAVKADGSQSVDYRTITFDKTTGRELTLADFFEGIADRTKPLEALAGYARADVRDQTGDEDETEVLFELTKPDLLIYERFTLCPSTRAGKAAGFTVHFPPSGSGLLGDAEFHVAIPYTVFAKYLKPAIKPLFQGEPRQAPMPWRSSSS